ncbi:MAG TPA: M20/M25/M40 family metallo-hydrolase [Acidimicrobiia bacterium]
MASRGAQQRWLESLVDIITASGKEAQVVAWVRKWAERRGHQILTDEAGNLLLKSVGRGGRRRPIVAVAHMDHPALVVRDGGHRLVEAELRGGVHPPYVESAVVVAGATKGRVVGYEPGPGLASIQFSAPVQTGAVARWFFPAARLGRRNGKLHGRACDDLAGVAAALSAFDTVSTQGLRHFAVLLTRAEEVGFIGAIAACRLGTLPDDAQILSIECSRASAEAPVGLGPVVRVGDASSAFSPELTNHLSAVARDSGVGYQRKLMSGGSCEATAFAAFGYEASGLCLPLGNYHNMVDPDRVLAGKRKARLAPEVISLRDYHALVDLLVATVKSLHVRKGDLRARLDSQFERESHVLEIESTPRLRKRVPRRG